VSSKWEPGWGLVFLCSQFSPIYAVKRVAFMVFLY